MAEKNTISITDNRTGKSYELPVENDTIRALDLRKIKVKDDDFGLMTYDPAFTNTASCKSAITFIDGDKGILEYRGYPIEQLAQKSTFLEVAYLLLKGELPTAAELKEFTHHISIHTYLHENLKKLMEGFRHDAHPMGMLALDGRRAFDVLPGVQEDLRQEDARARHHAPHREDAHDRGVRVPPLDRLPVRLPGQRPLVHGQLPLDDEEDGRAHVQGEPGPREGARRSLHPPRGPRAELLDERDARRSAPPRRTRTPASRRRRPPSTARSTAARTRPSSRCCTSSATSRTSPRS